MNQEVSATSKFTKVRREVPNGHNHDASLIHLSGIVEGISGPDPVEPFALPVVFEAITFGKATAGTRNYSFNLEAKGFTTTGTVPVGRADGREILYFQNELICWIRQQM